MTRAEALLIARDLIATVLLPAIPGEYKAEWLERRAWDPGITGVHVKLPNSIYFSVQWSDSHYSNLGRMNWEPGEDFTFEAAAFRYDDIEGNDWVRPSWQREDDVLAWATLPEIVKFMHEVVSLPAGVK